MRAALARQGARFNHQRMPPSRSKNRLPPGQRCGILSAMTMLSKRLALRLAALALLSLSASGWAKQPIGPTPLGEPGNWVTPDDYPHTALKGRAITGRYFNSVNWVLPKTLLPPQAAALVLTMVVAADGSIAECRIIRAEGAAAAVIAQGKDPCEQKDDYEPYQDASGNPIARRVTVMTEVKVEEP
jgi:hypothetical protein